MPGTRRWPLSVHADHNGLSGYTLEKYSAQAFPVPIELIFFFFFSPCSIRDEPFFSAQVFSFELHSTGTCTLLWQKSRLEFRLIQITKRWAGSNCTQWDLRADVPQKCHAPMPASLWSFDDSQLVSLWWNFVLPSWWDDGQGLLSNRVVAEGGGAHPFGLVQYNKA